MDHKVNADLFFCSEILDVDAYGVPEVTAATKRILTDFGETFEDYCTEAKHPLKKNPVDAGFSL